MIARTKKKLTYQDYVGFPNDGKRHELIDGDRYLNPAPSVYHQEVSRRIQFQLYTQIELPKLGIVANAPIDVQITPHDIVQPDLVIVLEGRSITTPTKIKGVPDHIIEILSPSSDRNDRVLKFNLYECEKVPEYWIVNPFEHEVQQCLLGPSGYQCSTHSERVRCSYLNSKIEVDLLAVW